MLSLITLSYSTPVHGRSRSRIFSSGQEHRWRLITYFTPVYECFNRVKINTQKLGPTKGCRFQCPVRGFYAKSIFMILATFLVSATTPHQSALHHYRFQFPTRQKKTARTFHPHDVARAWRFSSERTSVLNHAPKARTASPFHEYRVMMHTEKVIRQFALQF